MSKQSEALRLADAIDMHVRTLKLAGAYDGVAEQQDDAAAELRRLDRVNGLLLEALKAHLKRDERNTCRHEETHRGGVL